MTDNPSEETAPAQPNPPDGAESQTVGLTGSEPGKPSAAANEPPAAVGAASSAARFRILRPHAKGGLGEVSVAEDEELHREVALKEVQRRYADNPAMRTRFLVEAEITGGLEHPGIVPVYGLGQYPDGRPFYAMRFIRGNSLKQAIAQFHDTEELFGGLAFRQLLGRFVDVCNAMAYAHSRGVLHRDLKPGNIMLGKFGETLVVDWGLAKVRGQEARGRGQNAGSSQEGGAGAEPSLQPPSLSATDETMEGTAIGTTVFMSPEQAAGRLDLVGPASDIYSLGATLYVLLTGRTPFPSGNTIDNLRNVQAGAFPPPRRIKPAIPAPLEAICLKAMAREPQDRYAGALDLAADVEHWLADEPVSAWPEPVSVRLGRWMRKHKPLVSGVAAALVVGMVAATAGAIWYEREQAERAAQAARQAAERELRQEHVNKEIRFALDEADQKRADLQLKLEDPGQVYELLSDIDLWQARLQAARSAW